MTKPVLSPKATSDEALLDSLASELLRCSQAGGIVMLLPAAMLVDTIVDLLWSELRRDPMAVTVNLRPLSSVPAVGREDSSSRRTTSMAFSSSMIFGCLVMFSVKSTAIWTRCNLPFGEVFRIFVQGIITAQDVDARQQNLVWRIIQIYANPSYALVPATQVDFVEDLSRLNL
jgi:hypothetical protein